MGTLLDLQLLTGDEDVALRALAADLFSEVARLERLVSHYDPQSTVSRLTQTAGRGPRAVDAAVAELVRESLRYGEISQGAFDVTLGPVVEFWRDQNPLMPDRKEFSAVRQRAGLDKLRSLPGNRVELAAAGMELDFDGVAKGWALDRVVPMLREAEVAALVSFGQSSIWALGVPPSEDGWTLALHSPSGGVQGTVTLRDQALSVSSSFAQGESGSSGGSGDSHRTDGSDVSRIINPKTMYPIDEPAFAAVVAPSAGIADALSTALLVLDPYSAIKLVEATGGAEAMVVEPFGQVSYSSGWYRTARYVASETAE